MANEDRINRGSLLFSTAKIELSLRADELYEGSFEMKDDNGLKMEGCVYSSTIRMRQAFEKFEGSHIVVPFTFDTTGMQPGDTLKGNFYIVSDRGEYVLPFVTQIHHEVMDSSIGSIRNLFHFTNLARSNWEEAVKLFSKPGFIDIINGNDVKYRDLYLGLKGRGNKNYNLEEFLIGINKKQVVTYSVDKDSVRVVDPQGVVEGHIMLNRSSWGYTQVAVRVDGDFIAVDTNRLTEENFENDVCDYKYMIVEDLLHPGKNFGRITFKSLYGSVSVDITVVNNVIVKGGATTHKRKSIRFSLVRHYMDYATKRISQAKWIQLTEELLAHRAGFAEDDLENSLYQTHLLLVQERYNEAKWILDRKISPVIEDADNELYCYYLYLMTLYNVDEYYSREISDRMLSIYQKDETNWRVAWVLLNTSDEYKRNPARAYAFTIRQLSKGCNSPLFYVESIRLLNAMPSLLVHYDEDEKRLIYFAARNKLTSPELQGQIAYHAARQRDYDERTLKTLMYLYESRPDVGTLEAICSQLMKGNLTGHKYFEWYRLGVENNLKITRLYDCYMMSLRILSDEPIPRDVLMYFSYQSNLPVAQTSYLYAYVTRNREKMQDMYTLYRPAMERFVIKQLYAGRINRDLAYLYQELVLKEMATMDNIRAFAKVLLVHCIKISDSSIVNVAVLDERLDKELLYPVNGGLCYIPLLSTEYTVLLEDTLGNRYYQTKEYVTESYFLPRKLLPKIEKYTEDSLLFDLFVCEGNNEYITVTERNVGRYMYLLQSPEVSATFRSSIRMPLIRYYQDRDDTVKMDEIIEGVVKEEIPYKDRDQFIGMLLIRGYTDRAYEYVCYYGPETVDPKLVSRIATLIIDRDGMIEDYRLTGMIFSAFERGKYDETGLTYLVRFYRGLAKNLRDIWKAAGGFYVDTYHICEKMIEQTLNTGAYIGDEEKVLKAYISGGAKGDLVQRYLTNIADEYFVRDRITDEYMFREMARMYENERELPIVCMLAFLKFYADGNNLKNADDNIKNHIRRYVRILYTRHNIIMPFMKEFKAISPEAMELSDLTMIEYHGEANGKVLINYLMTRENTGRQGYTREEMVNVYGGVFVKSFLLFFGETIQYYITESNDGMEQLTESGTLNRNDVDSDGYENRFSMVNDIAIATTLKDYDTAEALLAEYKYREYLVNNLFDMM